MLVRMFRCLIICGIAASSVGLGIAKLARTMSSAASLPLPTKLEDAAVLVGELELAAPLSFVSPAQINAQLPFEAPSFACAFVPHLTEDATLPQNLLGQAAVGRPLSRTRIWPASPSQARRALPT